MIALWIKRIFLSCFCCLISLGLLLPEMAGRVAFAGMQNTDTHHAAFSRYTKSSTSLVHLLQIESSNAGIAVPYHVAQARSSSPSNPQLVSQKQRQGTSAPAQQNTRQSQVSTEKQFEALRVAYLALHEDRQKSGLRESWLRLEKNFEALQKKSKGTVALKAALYRAKTRDSLARRSHNNNDYQEAMNQYLRVVSAYPKTKEAQEALLAAVQLSVYCKQLQSAKQCAERLRKEYPKSVEAKKAADLSVHWKDAAEKNESGAGKTPSGSAASPQSGKATQGAAKDTGRAQAVPNSSGSGKKQSPAVLRSVHWNTSSARVVCRLQFGTDAPYDAKILPAGKGKNAILQIDLTPASVSKNVAAAHSPKDSLIPQMDIVTKDKGIVLSFDLGKARWYAVQKGAKGSGNLIVYASMVNDIPDAQAVSAGAGSQSGKASATSSGGDGRGQKPSARQSAGSVTLAEQLGLSVKTIMIDAGHGGKDPGAIGNGIVEKKFALTMAKKVGAQLQKHGFTVIYSRDKDVFISLPDRPSMANAKKVDLFLSLHANANLDSSINGVETYYLDTAQTRSAQLVAARENAVNVNNISDLQFILSDLMLSSKLEESRDLARSVQRGILGRVKKSKYAMNDNGVRSAPFYVLMGARMPAILIEFGYVTHTRDAENLKKEEFQNILAEGVAQGVLAYKKKLEKYAPK